MTSPSASPAGIFDLLSSDATATDGSGRGGPHVPRPLSNAGVSTKNTGSGNASYSASGTTIQGWVDDGAQGRVMKLTTTAATLPGLAMMRDTVYGSRVTPRFYADNTGSTVPSPFDYVIDGEAFGVEDVLPRQNNVALALALTNPHVECPYWIDDGKHTAEVYLIADTTTALKQCTVTGWDTAPNGNTAPPPPRLGGPAATASTVTTTAASVAFVSPATKSVHVQNNDSVSHIVSIQDPNNVVYWQQTLASGASADCVFDPPQAVSGWKIKNAEANGTGVVNYWSRS